MGWESGGSPQNLQRVSRPPNHSNRETPSQRVFANKANVPDSPLTRHSAQSGLQAGYEAPCESGDRAWPQTESCRLIHCLKPCLGRGLEPFFVTRVR